MSYLIDTNILIYFFNGKMTDLQKESIKEIFENSFNISVITKIEFLGWNKHTEKSFYFAKDFLKLSYIIELDQNITEKVITLKRKYKIKLGDAIIAASAIYYHYTLLTRNQKDFERIDELKIVNPF